MSMNFSSFSKLFCFLCCFFSTTWSCPSDTWVECAQAGQTCVIPSTINATTIALGDNDNDIWTFVEVQNYAHPAQSLSINCGGSSFGNPDPASSNQLCCYNPFGNTIAVNGEFGKSSNWLIGGNVNEQQFNVPYVDGMPRWVRYGLNGQFVFGLFNYQVDCSTNLFTDPTNSGNNECWYYNQPYNATQWIACGSNIESVCNLKVDTQDTEIIRIVKYGEYNSTNFAYHDQFYYRFSYSKNSGSVQCSDSYFNNVNTGSTVFCYVAPVEASNLFVNPVGSWIQTGSCSNCVLHKEIEYGVTSTSTYATTDTWSKELSQTISASAHFLFSHISYSITETMSQSLAVEMSGALSVTASMSCTADCGSANGTYYLYQWVMNVGEIIDTDISNFKIYSCQYICEHVESTVPQCPPSACNNTVCTQCKPWKA